MSILDRWLPEQLLAYFGRHPPPSVVDPKQKQTGTFKQLHILATETVNEFDRWVVQHKSLRSLVFISELGLKPSHCIVGSVGVILSLRFLGVALAVICNGFALVYPCWGAYKTLSKRHTTTTTTANNAKTEEDKETKKMEHWLMYFLLFFLWTATLDPLYWCWSALIGPQDILYYGSKSVVLLMLYQPGATLLQRIFATLSALIAPHESRIDNYLDQVEKSKMGSKLTEVMQVITKTQDAKDAKSSQ